MKKPSYSLVSNFIWSLKMLCRYSKSALFLTALFVPVRIGMKYLEIYLPALVVSEVEAGRPLKEAMFSVGGMLFMILVTTIILQALEHIRYAAMGIYQCQTRDLVTRKKLTMYYQSYEKKEMHDLAERATMATFMWNGEQPLSDLISNGFGIIENVLGYLLFGAVISFANPWIVPILTIAPVINILSVKIYNKWEYANRAQRTDLDQRLGHVQRLTADCSKGKDIRIYSMASWLKECYKDLSSRREEWDRKIVNKKSLSRIAELLVVLVRDGGAYALLISMFYRKEIGIDEFVLYFAAISSFASWIDGIIRCWTKTQTFSLKICDFREYLDYPEYKGRGVVIAEDYKEQAPEIEFQNVSFRYDGAETDTISNFSIHIKPGEKLAIVGLNGAGKTTLVKLLCNLYKPVSGVIYYNGVPLEDFNIEEYYKLIAPVFQEVHTSFFSLAETVSGVRLDETNLEKVEKCIRQVGLGAKLDELPDGIYTKLNKQIHKDGTEFSGGEAQKLMLARALYKDAPLLILDEPTAALDPIAESKMYNDFNSMSMGKTSIFISHRLASTAFCDRILLLENGIIEEEGTHDELMTLDGKYKELYDIQSCWYKEVQE